MTSTYFRRAVGLELRASLCRAPAEDRTVTVVVPRHGGTRTETVALEDAHVLMRLSRWQDAAELRFAEEDLHALVRRNLVLFAPGARPMQDLCGFPMPATAGRIRWRTNAWVTPLVSARGQVGPMPFMPRRRDVRGAELCGVHVALMERGQQATGMGVACCGRHGRILRSLCASLTRGLDAEALDAESLHALDLLRLCGVVEAAAPLAAEPAKEGSAEATHAARLPSVTWLGHASVLCDGGPGTPRVLVDPLFHPRSDPFREGQAQPPDPRDLPPVDALVITHGDNDHFNPVALCRFPTETPVFLPRAVPFQRHQVDMAGALRVLGFTRVHALRAGETAALGAGCTLHAFPFHGENWGLRLPNLTYGLTFPALRAYFSADASRMPEVMERVRTTLGSLDVAFLGVGGCEEALVMPPAYGYGNFYASALPTAEHNRWVRHCSDPADAAEAAAILRPRRVFGYAAGGAPYIRVAYTDRGTHAQLCALLGPDSGVPLDLQPGVPFRLD